MASLALAFEESTEATPVNNGGVVFEIRTALTASDMAATETKHEN